VRKTRGRKKGYETLEEEQKRSGKTGITVRLPQSKWALSHLPPIHGEAFCIKEGHRRDRGWSSCSARHRQRLCTTATAGKKTQSDRCPTPLKRFVDVILTICLRSVPPLRLRVYNRQPRPAHTLAIRRLVSNERFASPGARRRGPRRGPLTYPRLSSLRLDEWRRALRVWGARPVGQRVGISAPIHHARAVANLCCAFPSCGGWATTRGRVGAVVCETEALAFTS